MFQKSRRKGWDVAQLLQCLPAGTLGFDTQYHRKPEAETKDCSKLSLATQGVCVQSGLCVTFVGGVGGRVERLRGITLVQFLLT